MAKAVTRFCLAAAFIASAAGFALRAEAAEPIPVVLGDEILAFPPGGTLPMRAKFIAEQAQGNIPGWSSILASYQADLSTKRVDFCVYDLIRPNGSRNVAKKDNCLAKIADETGALGLPGKANGNRLEISGGTRALMIPIGEWAY